MTNMIGPIERVTMVDHPVKGMHFMVTGSPQVQNLSCLKARCTRGWFFFFAHFVRFAQFNEQT